MTEHPIATTAQRATLAELAAQHPQHKLWTEALPGRLRFVAQAIKGSQARPFAVITDDLGELRQALDHG